ncbi:MAG: hypothetical protein ACP5HS_04845 [Anaerolineae bacterium]
MAIRTLYQTLLDSEPARLRVIARQWDVALNASRKADMAAELVDAIASAEAVARMLERLTPEQREALDDLLRRDGMRPWTIFVQQWGEVRSVGAGRVEREELWQEPVSAAEALWYLGLVQRAFDEREQPPVEMAFVPEELRLYMPAPPEVDIPSPQPTDPPTNQFPGGDTLAEDLVTVWATLQQGERFDRQRLSRLHAPEAERLDLIETLSLESGWLREDRHLRPVASTVLAWLTSTVWSQWSSLASAWMTSGQWNDLAHVPTLNPDPVKGWPNDPRNTRQQFLEALARCEPGAWYDIESFIAYVKAEATYFLRPDGDFQSWAPRDAHTESPLRGFDVWDAVEGALISYLISGPLHWLGFVSLGNAMPTSSPSVFALTEAGSAFLNQGPPPELPTPPALTLGPNGDLVVPYRRRYERFQLSRIADLVTAPQEYRYRLSPSSLDRAKKQRIPYDRITSFLTEATGDEPLPPHLIKAIQRAYQGTQGARISHAWILRVPDPEYLTLPAMVNLIEERITPTIATVRHNNRERVLKVLIENGLLTDVETDEPPHS